MTPQTPPTDRPLTAGDVPLLRDGDVLRDPDGLGTFDSCVDGWVQVTDAQGVRMGFQPKHITFVSRPESEGEDAVLVPREHVELALSLIDDMSRFVGQMSLRSYATFNDAPIYLRRALASPPVSERERELEGALRCAVEGLEWIGRLIVGSRAVASVEERENDLGLSVNHIQSAALRAAAEARKALTAQPAGEPTHD